MLICVPTLNDQGIDSVAYSHFGSAPCFIIHDTQSGTTEALLNNDSVHEHGACNPLAVMASRAVEAVVVGGIGARAIQGLNSAGIRVYMAIPGTVADNVRALTTTGLIELSPQQGCSGHAHGPEEACHH